MTPQQEDFLTLSTEEIKRLAAWLRQYDIPATINPGRALR